jgi:SAM-dependent methyltransferase
MDINAFRSFEYRGWEGAVENYDRHFSPLTRQTIGPLLDVVQAGPNTSLLDVASGPGHVAAAAQRRGTKAIGVDFSQAMIERAFVLYPGLVCCLGDAELLPFGESAFDAGAMNFGILHLAQPEIAIQEAYRVLRPEGRFAFSVWDKPEKAVGFGLALRAIGEFGDPNAPVPEGPPFFRFSDPAEFSRVFEEAGFSDMDVVTLPLIWELSSPEDLFDAFYLGTARTGGLLRSQSASALGAIREAISRDAVQYLQDGRLMIPMSALVVAARKS